MPQLDKVTLFSQVFWLITLYFIFFIGFVKYYLPSFSKLFKVRAYIISLSEKKDSETSAASSGLIFNQFNLFLSQSLTIIHEAYTNTLHAYNNVILSNINNIFKVVYVVSCIKLSVFKGLGLFSNGVKAD